MNPMDQVARDNAPPIARHEFGHYIAAKVLGFKVTDVTLTMTFPNGHRGTSDIEPATTISSLHQAATYIENRIVVLYAGALAESLSCGKVNNDEALQILGADNGIDPNAPAAQDYSKARELVHLLRSITYEMSDDSNVLNSQLKEVSDRVWSRAIEIVEAESYLIEGMGRRLADLIKKSGVKVTMTKAEIDETPAIQARFSN